MEVDSELVRAVQRGTPGAMDALVRATYADVHRLCLRLLGDRADAADATQEVFIRVTRSVMGFRGEAAFSTWLHRVTVNVCATALRRRGDRRARGQVAGWRAFAAPGEAEDAWEAGAAGDDPAGKVVELDEADRVAQAIRALPASDRDIVVLRDIDGLSTREAAKILGITEGAAKVRLHRAHAKLRAAIGPMTEGAT
jgi:RNA polymerase sigma-70 factor (ECF subfamily)